MRKLSCMVPATVQVSEFQTMLKPPHRSSNIYVYECRNSHVHGRRKNLHLWRVGMRAEPETGDLWYREQKVELSDRGQKYAMYIFRL